ncbi:MAG: hypothetical protein UH854_03105 [Clostridia bacterium]|nr:hypothetical protein [Clostridia bacterium]
MHAKDVKFDEALPDYERNYDLECMNDMLKTFLEKGFFVTYNHPKWSLETYELYMQLENMHAMEICNGGSTANGYEDRNSKEYDDMLRGGKKIYCIAADDAHMRGTVDAFGGFTMIKADKLEYKTITDALVNGNFYASEGPIINQLWYEDGKVYVTFEPAREAFITKGVRLHRGSRVIGENGELITQASFDVGEDDIYFRITVEGPDGRRAYTNAYFIDDIIGK